MPPAVRVRRSAALVFSFEAGVVVGESFLARKRAALAPHAIGLLTLLESWRTPEELFAGVEEPEARTALAAEIVGLIDLGFIVVEGSPVADLDERYRRDWKWGASAGLYHFGIKDPEYVGPAQAYEILTQRAATHPSPPLYATNDGLPRTPLAPPDPSGFVAHLAGRRSTRAFDATRQLPLAALRDCLYAGLAIVAFGESSLASEGLLPLKPTPSGGARNPFDAYVVARDVEGLAPGVYHYAGIDHSLGLVRAGMPPSAEVLLGGQAWFAGAAAVVILVASFERCWWKYPHPTGFRVVLLEAGHIAQNLLLAAAEHDLAATPTCAVSDRALEELIGLDRVTQAAVHTVALGRRAPAPSYADLPSIVPNPRLPR